MYPAHGMLRLNGMGLMRLAARREETTQMLSELFSFFGGCWGAKKRHEGLEVKAS
jgi:hypothetical protein